MTTESTAAKLAEKLGFRIETGGGFFTLIYKTGGRHAATAEEVTLWNLCLELSERVETAERERDQLLRTYPFNSKIQKQSAEKEKKA